MGLAANAADADGPAADAVAANGAAVAAAVGAATAAAPACLRGGAVSTNLSNSNVNSWSKDFLHVTAFHGQILQSVGVMIVSQK